MVFKIVNIIFIQFLFLGFAIDYKILVLFYKLYFFDDPNINKNEGIIIIKQFILFYKHV